MAARLEGGEFAASRREERRIAAEERRRSRDAAVARLIEARADYALAMDGRYAAGARLAARDSDRLETIARRMHELLSALEPDFERLDVARDVAAWIAADGLRLERSAWRVPDAAEACEVLFSELISPEALRVLSAAARLEALA